VYYGVVIEMLKRVAFVFGVVLFVSPLMFLGSIFRQANVSGLPVFSKENILSALPLFGVAFGLIFIGLLIPWDSDDSQDCKKSEDEPD